MTKQDLKIVFFGTPEFAVASLDRLATEGFNVAAVVTATDKPAGRGHRLLQSDVKRYAVEKGIPVLQPSSLKDPAFIAQLEKIGADLFIVIAFRMLPEAVWTMPPLGTFNLHGSLLPRYRGAAPINWAIINGDSETGVTTFFLKHEIDTGDIIDQAKIAIGPDENLGSVYDRLMHIGADLTVGTVNRIIDGTLTTTPQNSTGLEAPTPAPKIFKETCRIDWGKDARAIHNLVRGLSPVPGAWTMLATDDTDNTTVKIFETYVSNRPTDLQPGQIMIDGTKLLVVCGDRSLLEIKELQPAGKRRMGASEYIRGARLGEAHFASIK